jgi:hypothetical protein
MQDVLLNRFGFAPDAVLVLRDKQATRQGILDAFRGHLIERATPDEVSVFFFSGHGSEVVDLSGDEPKGWDQTLVSQDSGRGDRANRDISDDELNALLLELQRKTSHVVFIADSCHSGTVTRHVGAVKAVPRDERNVSARKAPGAGAGPTGDRRGFLLEGPGYVLISGAATNEFSFERVIDGRPMGALTSFLTRALWRSEPGDTYRDIMAQVAPDVTSALPAQHPQLEGSSLDTELFGTRQLPPSAFFELRGGGEMVELLGGLIRGVSVGSRFAVYPPKTKNFTQATAIAELEIVEVGGVSSKAKLISGTAPLPVGARALETLHKFDGQVLRVKVDRKNDDPVLRQIEQQLREHPQIVLAREGADYDMLVFAEKGADKTVIQLERSTQLGRGKRLTTVPAAPGVDVATHVVEVLLRWGRWHAARRLENNASNRASAALSTNAGSAKLSAGTSLAVTVDNKSIVRLYLSVFDLSDDGSISQVYPVSGANEYMEPKTSWTKSMLPCVPTGRSSVDDVIKVFLTDKPHDLSFLEQPALSRPVDKSLESTRAPIEHLLALQGLGRTRGMLPDQVPPAGWATLQVAYELEANPGATPCPQR